MTLAEIIEKWAVPPSDMVDKLPKGGTTLDYMGHAAVTRALIDVDPEWTWEPVTDERGIPVIETHDKRMVMWGSLTVLGKTVMCCGTCETRKFEPEKELIGDLLRNGAMRFGIGLSLWSKSEWHEAPEPAPPATPFDALFPAIEQLDAEAKQELKDFAAANGWKVTRKDLTQEQAEDLAEWIAQRGPF